MPSRPQSVRQGPRLESLPPVQTIKKHKPIKTILLNFLTVHFGYGIKGQGSLHKRTIKQIFKGHTELLNSIDENGKTPILREIALGNAKMVERLLKQGARVSIKEIDLVTETGNSKIYDLLLMYGIDTKSSAESAIYRYAWSNDSKRAKFLIDKGIDVKATLNGLTTLHQAARHHNPKLVKLFIEKDSSLVEKMDLYGNTPLHLLAQTQVAYFKSDKGLTLKSGYTETANLLINAQTINTRNARGLTPLQTAILSGNWIVADQLISNGATIDASDLNLALEQGNLRAAKLLKEKGANLDVHESLRLAVQNGKIEHARLLIEEFGADVNALTHQRQNPIDTVLAKNDEAMIHFLLDKKATLNTSQKNTLLRRALSDENEETALKNAHELVKKGVNLNNTLFHQAIRSGDLSLTRRLLLLDPFLIIEKTKHGDTALHLALKLEKPSLELIKLVARPEIIDEQNKEGDSAIHIAVRKQHEVAFNYLLSMGAETRTTNRIGETLALIAIQLDPHAKLEITKLLNTEANRPQKQLKPETIKVQRKTTRAMKPEEKTNLASKLKEEAKEKASKAANYVGNLFSTKK